MKYDIEIIAEHSVCLSMLPNKANVLDLGCRGFLFTEAIRGLGHHVWPVDLDELHEDRAYYQCAVSNFDGRVGIEKNKDPQATKIKAGDTVPCYTLETLTGMFIKGTWDLVKMDIEGAEYDVILSLTKPLAKQLSIEFHCHTGQITQKMMMEMENKLKNLGYEFISHAQSQQHGAGWNYWDSLFILK